MRVVDFVEQNLHQFDLSGIAHDDKYDLIEQCLEVLQKFPPTQKSGENETTLLSHATCLKILTRDKSCLDKLCEEASIALIMTHSLLSEYATQNENAVAYMPASAAVITECTKILFNMIFTRASEANKEYGRTCCLGIIRRVQIYELPEITFDLKYFDMRLLFLITALAPQHRMILLCQHNAMSVFSSFLHHYNSSLRQTTLDEKNVTFLNEALRVMFNIALGKDMLETIPIEIDRQFEKLVSEAMDLLLRQEGLLNDVVNLLVAVPVSALQKVIDASDDQNPTNTLPVVKLFVKFLHHQLLQPGSSKETLTPIFNLLTTLCRFDDRCRKRCRQEILPPLGDEVKRRPEKGNSMRNLIIKLFTSHDQSLAESAAYFVFILCKENVDRCIKYTGYGNFAGFLLRNGLMSGQPMKHPILPSKDEKTSKAGDNSSSSDSETEEYAQLKSEINPITGKWEKNKKDIPMEDWSEERKEYEAMQLVNKIDQLCKIGTVKPMTFDAAGNLIEVEHVNELLASKVNDTSAANESDE